MELGRQEANLVDHITFWVPALISHVSVDLDELLQDRSAAPGALCRESCRVVVMAIDIPVVFVVRIMGTEKGRTYRAGEVFHVILLAWVRSNYGSTEAWIRYGHTAGGDITSPQCHTTLGTDKVQTPEVIPFA